MDLLVDKSHITEYIPQRFSMVMIDGIKEYQSGHITTIFDITAQNIFLTNGCLSESGMLENIAQSAAAMSGLQCKQAGKSIPLGFIAAISKVTCSNSPKIGEQIETTIELQRKVIGITLVRGTCQSQGEELLSCEMKIFIEESK